MSVKPGRLPSASPVLPCLYSAYSLSIVMLSGRSGRFLLSATACSNCSFKVLMAVIPLWVKVRLDGADVKHQSRKRLERVPGQHSISHNNTGVFLSANVERMTRVDT